MYSPLHKLKISLISPRQSATPTLLPSNFDYPVM